MKKATYSEEQSRPRKADHTTKPRTKIARVLAHLLTGASLNRFEAERMGDHCLPSTVAALANRYGLTFQRRAERVPNGWGDPCDVTRYSLPSSERQRARAVLLALETKPVKEVANAE